MLFIKNFDYVEHKINITPIVQFEKNKTILCMVCFPEIIQILHTQLSNQLKSNYVAQPRSTKSHLSKYVYTSGRCNVLRGHPWRIKVESPKPKELLCLGFVVFQLYMITGFFDSYIIRSWHYKHQNRYITNFKIFHWTEILYQYNHQIRISLTKWYIIAFCFKPIKNWFE